jgi:type IV pilus assembly protein PilF
MQSRQPERAMEAVRRAQRSDPDAPEVQVVLAQLYQSQGEARKAARTFRRALKADPVSGIVRNAHGVWLCEQDQFDEADAEFARAQRDPGYATPGQAIGNAGRCAHRAKRWPRAEAALRHALEFAPEDGTLLYLLADTELHQGKLLEARAFAQRRDALGDDAATLDLAARIEDAAGDRAAAARYRQRLGDAFPAHVPTGEGATTP